MNSQNSLTRDDFENWLILMDRNLEEFLMAVPSEMRSELDFSPMSLDKVEAWLIEQYPTKEALLEESQLHIFDCVMCYVGETFRKNLRGIWNVNLDNPNFRYGRLPIIEGFDKRGSILCPPLLILAAIEMRVGSYLSTGLQAWISHNQYWANANPN